MGGAPSRCEAKRRFSPKTIVGTGRAIGDWARDSSVKMFCPAAEVMNRACTRTLLCVQQVGVDLIFAMSLHSRTLLGLPGFPHHRSQSLLPPNMVAAATATRTVNTKVIALLLLQSTPLTL